MDTAYATESEVALTGYSDFPISCEPVAFLYVGIPSAPTENRNTDLADLVLLY